MNEKVDIDSLHPEICSFATGCCMLINSAIIKKIGILDEVFFFCIVKIQSSVSEHRLMVSQ